MTTDTGDPSRLNHPGSGRDGVGLPLFGVHGLQVYHGVRWLFGVEGVEETYERSLLQAQGERVQITSEQLPEEDPATRGEQPRPMSRRPGIYGHSEKGAVARGGAPIWPR